MSAHRYKSGDGCDLTPLHLRTREQLPAAEHFDAIAERYGIEAGLSDEQWAERDAAVDAKAKGEAARSREYELRERCKSLAAHGAPRGLLDLLESGGVEKDGKAMSDVKAWQQSRNRIAVLSGSVGVGKTVAAVRWLANHGGLSPCFVRAGDFEARGRYNHKFRDAWQNASGMVLDDMGAEYKDAKGNLIADLDTLVDTYAVGRGRLIITTNLTWQEFQERYEERISSRIVGSASWINVAGVDRRRLTK